MSRARVTLILLVSLTSTGIASLLSAAETELAPIAASVAVEPTAFTAIPDRNEVSNGARAEECPDVVCQAGTCCDACPTVYGQVEGLLLQRVPRTVRQPVIIDFNTEETILSTANVGSDWDGGLRATFGVRLNDRRALEFTYLGVFEGRSSAEASPASPDVLFTFPGDLGWVPNVFFGADRVEMTYTSRLHSFEWNLPCCRCCCDGVHCRSFEWFAGFRYVSLDEDLNIYGERNEYGGTETGFYDTHTRNNLYGAQLGTRIRRGWNNFRWEFTGKAGIFGNDAKQTQYLVDFPDYFLRPEVSGHGGQTSFVGEINVSAVYRLTNVWGLRAGYNLLWIEGVALAPDQLDFSYTDVSGSGLNNAGGVFLHGFSTGIEARW